MGYQTIKDFSSTNNLAEQTVRRWIRDGKLAFIQPSGHKGKILIDENALKLLHETKHDQASITVNKPSNKNLPGRKPKWQH